MGINLARTDEILETKIPIDSAIVGMTANVFLMFLLMGVLWYVFDYLLFFFLFFF